MGMHDPCDKPFQLASRRDLLTSRSNLLLRRAPQVSEFACSCWACPRHRYRMSEDVVDFLNNSSMGGAGSLFKNKGTRTCDFSITSPTRYHLRHNGLLKFSDTEYLSSSVHAFAVWNEDWKPLQTVDQYWGIWDCYRCTGMTLLY